MTRNASVRSISMLPFFVALFSGCAIPSDPGLVDGDEAEAASASKTPDQPSAEDPRTLPSPDAPVLESAPADYLFLVDRSASWSKKADRWEGLRIALDTFVGEHEAPPQRLSLGPRAAPIPAPAASPQFAANVFPHQTRAGHSCDAEDYTLLDRPWTSQAGAIARFIGALDFKGGSTLGPALSGTLVAATRHAISAPRRSTSIVLLTDATPGDDETCGDSAWERVARIAGSGFHDGLGPAVHTHVLSVVGSAISPDHFTRIQAIAAAGNGYSAVVNGSRDDVASGAGMALTDIHDRMTTCTYVVPEGVRPEELTIRSPDGSVATAKRTGDGASCSGATFYLDDPASPRLLTLCSGNAGVGGFCEATFVRAQVSGKPRVTVSATAH